MGTNHDRAKLLETMAPYDIIKDRQDLLSTFLRRCHTCKRAQMSYPTTAYTPWEISCPILDALIRSIVDDKTIRWSADDIELGDKSVGPVCKKFDAEETAGRHGTGK